MCRPVEHHFPPLNGCFPACQSKTPRLHVTPGIVDWTEFCDDRSAAEFVAVFSPQSAADSVVLAVSLSPSVATQYGLETCHKENVCRRLVRGRFKSNFLCKVETRFGRMETLYFTFLMSHAETLKQVLTGINSFAQMLLQVHEAHTGEHILYFPTWVIS